MFAIVVAIDHPICPSTFVIYCILTQGHGSVTGFWMNAGVFSPPLSQQRYQHVAAALREAAATDILDLGCGDGKLLEHLLSAADGGRHGTASNDSGVQWRRLAGLDISESAVARGAKRLQVPRSFLLTNCCTQGLPLCSVPPGPMPARHVLWPDMGSQARSSYCVRHLMTYQTQPRRPCRVQELKQRSGATCEVEMRVANICSADEGALPDHLPAVNCFAMCCHQAGTPR